MTDIETSLNKAAKLVRQAEGILVGTGAGMGVDSGLPDFRGNEGFWRAYPPIAKLGLRFDEMANPRWFANDPTLAWGFYGHRLHLYRDATPHDGFGILTRWAENMPLGNFVYTSNVDGHFQRAGLAPGKILECHGSLNHLQCLADCGQAIWPAEDTQVSVDLATLRASPPLPACPSCGELARPNVLMFSDWGWDSGRTNEQHKRFLNWTDKVEGSKIIAIEIGAGKAVPTVRHACEQFAADSDGNLIRINPRDVNVPRGSIALPLGGLEALNRLDEILNS